jgi:hypothetical protein
MDNRLSLRYLRVPVKESFMFGGNKSVVNSSNIPTGKLHKRHIALSWHRVRESIAAKVLHFVHIPSAIDPADMLSKHWGYQQTWPQLQALLLWQGDATALLLFRSVHWGVTRFPYMDKLTRACMSFEYSIGCLKNE